MDDMELARIGLPGVGHATDAAPNMGWRAAGIVIWPKSGKVGIRHWHGTRDVRASHFGCSECGWGSQPWSEWVSLARRIIAADEAMEVAQTKEAARPLI